MRKAFRHISVLAVFGMLVAGCSASLSPAPEGTQSSIEPTYEVQPTPAPTPIPAVPEQRMLTLEWPETLRQGDSDTIRLTLEMDDQGHITPTAQTGGHTTTGEVVEIPNLYETHSVFAEARLDLAGMEVAPAELVSQSLLPGKTVTFTWSIRPSQASVYRGNVWFYLRFVPKSGGDEMRIAISAQPIDIRVTNLLGLSGQPARWVGAIGSVIGSALGIDSVAGWGWKLIKRKRVLPATLGKG